MLSWLKRKINFLETSKDRWLFIAVYFGFGVLFVNLFEPFSLYQWSEFKTTYKILLVSSHILPFCGVFIITQFLIRPFFKTAQFTILLFSLWILMEILLISIINILIFEDPKLIFSIVFVDAFHYSSLVLLICYFFSLTILSIGTKTTFFQKENKTSLIPIRNYKNKVKLTLDHTCILCVKSTENYVQIFYLVNGEVKKALIRNTLKTLEKLLEPYGILRVQRSYLVNKKHISTIEHQNKKLVLYLKYLEDSIPLSNSYNSNFSEFIIHKNKHD